MKIVRQIRMIWVIISINVSMIFEVFETFEIHVRYNIFPSVSLKLTS